ncbi:hypothetical protein, partial [Pseudomonas sp. SDO5591_S426]
LKIKIKIKRSQPAAAPTGGNSVFLTVPGGRKAASSGNRLPLFWHCRVATARKAPVYGLF